MLGTPISALLHQRGLIALHAGAIQTERGAILFAGKSGSGKSTLTAAFHQQGYPILSDDLIGITLNEQGHPLALPALPRMRIWSDTASRLNINTHDLQAMRQGVEKYLFPVENFCQEPLPIYAIYTIESHNCSDFRILSIKNKDKYTWLFKHTYRKKIMHALGASQHHFCLATAVAKSIKMTSIIRPVVPFQLKELMEIIKKDSELTDGVLAVGASH